MAATLPNTFVWQFADKYLHLEGEIGGQKGILQFTEKAPKYVFEPEDESGNMKIKCSENSLYLKGVQSPTGGSSTMWLIVAAAESHEDSTSFELKTYKSINNTQGSFRLLHVKSNLYLRPHKVAGGSNAVLCAVEQNPDAGNGDLFTATGHS